MKRLSFVLILFSLISASASFALDVRSLLTQKKSFLGVSGEYSKFALDESAITGSGVRIDFSHAFTDKMNLELFLASAVSTVGSVQSSFTGLGGYAMYNVFGNCCQEEKTIAIDGKPMLTETIEKGSSLQIGLGLDQYFLNGSKAVYSSSGLGAAINYQFKLFKYNFKAGYRHSQLSSGQTKIGGDFISLGLVFSL